MRVMAVDFGDARTGIAVSDESASLVGEVKVVHERSMQKVAGIIAEEAAKRGVSCVVVGYPINMNGTVGLRGEKSEQLVQLIRDKCNVEVKLCDERLTSISANRILIDVGKRGKKRKQAVDAVAAALILEGYLQSLK